MNTAITWFEIPATNLNRAANFYAQVVDKELIRETSGPHEMAVFPYERASGIGGCVVSMDTLKPSTTGSVVYLYVGKDPPRSSAFGMRAAR